MTTGAAATFNLVFNGQTTANLASNTTPAAVKAQLQALTSVIPSGVLVTGTTGTAGGMTIVFEQPGTLSVVPITGGSTTTALSDVVLTQATLPSGNVYYPVVGNVLLNAARMVGTFTVTFNGQVTSAIPYNAPLSQVQSSIQALTTVGPGNAIVAGATTVGFTLGVRSAGTYLTFDGATTNAIAFGANAATVQAAIPQLPTVGTVTVVGTNPTFNVYVTSPTTTGLPTVTNAGGDNAAISNTVTDVTYTIGFMTPGTFTSAGTGGPTDSVASTSGLPGESDFTPTTGTLTLSSTASSGGTFTLTTNDATTSALTYSPGVGAQQTLTFAGNTNATTFTLVFNGATTSAITYSTTAATLASNLETGLESVLGTGNVLVTGTGPFTVSFVGNLAFGASRRWFSALTTPAARSRPPALRPAWPTTFRARPRFKRPCKDCRPSAQATRSLPAAPRRRTTS